MKRFESIRASAARRGGYTLLEVTIALALVCLILGTLAAVYPALTEASVETQLFMMAQIENDKARLQLTEDLQTTDSTRSDVSGVPYFKIIDGGSGSDSALFRRAEGFEIDAVSDVVSTLYGTEITYSVDANNHLIRSQDGVDRLIATNVKKIKLSKNIEGAITIKLDTMYTRRGEEHIIQTELQMVPRNVLKM